MFRVGIIGCGYMGKAHAETIKRRVPRAEVVAVSDVHAASAERLSAQLGGVTVFREAIELIRSDQVDGVVVTVPAVHHTDIILAAVSAGKHVFVEKPLAESAAECKRIVDAEVAGGRRLVQVGFMKRFDKGYQKMRELIRSGEFGEPLVVRTTQRAENISEAYPYYKSSMQITDSVIHDIDLLPWIVGDDWSEVHSLASKVTKNAGEGLQDPLVAIMKTTTGVLCVVEHFVNTGFVGFEVTTEIVCENGIINLPVPSSPVIRRDSQMSIAIESDWLVRFEEAYESELLEWVENALIGTAGGSSAWDGFTAAITADALLTSQTSGKPARVVTGAVPELYVL